MKKKLNESKVTELREVYHGKGKIIESDASKLPSGVLCRVRYPICMIDKKNRNERIYRKAVWDRVLENKELKEKLERRILFGNQEHPVESALKLNKDDTSHIISNIGINEKDNTVFADFDVLPTEAGKFINVLLEAGCDVGTSTRAEGELEEKIEEKTGDKYYEVVPESYQFITVDFTADPSTIGAYPMEIQRNVVDHVATSYEAKRINKDVAVALLEGIKTKEAVALMESIQKIKEGDGVKEEPKPAEEPKVLDKGPKDDPAPKAPIDGKTPNADQQSKDLKPDEKGEQEKGIQVGDKQDHIEQIDKDKEEDEKPEAEKKKAEKLEGAEEPKNEPTKEAVSAAEETDPDKKRTNALFVMIKDPKISAWLKQNDPKAYQQALDAMKDARVESVEKKLAFENFDDMVNYLKAEFRKVKPETQKRLRSTLSECMAASEIQKRINVLKNEKAVTEAKLERAIAMYDQLKESYTSDATSYTQRIENLKKTRFSLADKAVKEAKEILEKKHQEELAAVRAECETKLAEAKKEMESKIAEIENEAADSIAEFTAKKDAEIKGIQEAHTKDLLRKYFETKVTVTGLDEHLAKNAPTLLEHCVSEADVDQVIDKLRDGVRLGTLSPTISEVKLTKQESPERMQLNNRVGKILEKINP